MLDQETVEQLARETGLLGRGATAEERRINAARFTRLAAARLSWRGWGNVRAIGVGGVNGLEVDKLIHEHSGEVALIVRHASATTASAVWEPLGKESIEHYVEPSSEEELLVDPIARFDAIQTILLRIEEKLDLLGTRAVHAEAYETRTGQAPRARAPARRGVA